jgi:hypothetical protein
VGGADQKCCSVLGSYKYSVWLPAPSLGNSVDDRCDEKEQARTRLALMNEVSWKRTRPASVERRREIP